MNKSPAFYSFNSYLKNIFGRRVHKISIDAGFSCPNLDGKLSGSGCVYCNNKAFSRFSRTPKPLAVQIRDSIEFYREKMKVSMFIAYFQAFSGTYADTDRLKETYDIIRGFPEIVGLFISTRPDCVDKEKIKLIAGYQKDYLVWIEYGLQSTQDNLLRALNRNHTFNDFLTAAELSREHGIKVGVHIILGLPGHDKKSVELEAGTIARLKIDGIKFHVLHVLKDTELESIYKEGKLKLFSRREYVSSVCDFLERIPARTVILRLISTAYPDYLIAPAWINNRNEVTGGIIRELEKRNSFQGARYEGSCNKS